MNGIELLKLAAQLNSPTANRMAHALGWPQVGPLNRTGKAGRVKWANPYRNGYLAVGLCPHWGKAAELGLAVATDVTDKPVCGDVYWTVTELGKRVLRVRLEASRLGHGVAP